MNVDLNDETLQLLSRPSTANTTIARKSRKKVTFSNSVLQRENDNGIFDERSYIKSPQNGNSNVQVDTRNELGISHHEGSYSKQLNRDIDDDELPSFSRSKRVDQGYYQNSFNDINGLFQMNDTSRQITNSNKSISTDITKNNGSKHNLTMNECPPNLGYSGEHDNGMRNGIKSSHIDIQHTQRHTDSEVLLTHSKSNVITSTGNNDNGYDDEIKSSNHDNISIPTSPKVIDEPAVMKSSYIHRPQSLSNTPVHFPHNNNNSVNINNDNKTNLLLQSITNKLQENIGTLHQLESKFDSSQKGTEETLLENNNSLYNKLEENVIKIIKTHHDDDNQKIHIIDQKIDSMMISMLDLFKQESEKIDKKQMELTTLQTTIIEEQKQMKASINAERAALMEKYNTQNQQIRQSNEENQMEKLNLERYKIALDERESELLTKEEQHRLKILQDQHELELEKAKMKIQKEKIKNIEIELDKENQIITQQSLNQKQTLNKIEKDRLTLQSMAEHLSQLSHDLIVKSKYVDDKLHRIEKVNNHIESTKALIMNEQVNLQHDRYSIMSCVDEMNVMKMDIVRQRVQYLKDKFKD